MIFPPMTFGIDPQLLAISQQSTQILLLQEFHSFPAYIRFLDSQMPREKEYQLVYLLPFSG